MPELMPEERLRQIAVALEAVPPVRMRPARRERRPRPFARRRLVVAVVALAVAAAGTATATGLLDHEAPKAFAPKVANLRDGRTADQHNVTLVVDAKTPDGRPAQVWVSPLHGSATGSCVAIVMDYSADPKSKDWGSRFAPGAACGSDRSGAVLADADGSRWVSHEGKAFMAETANAGDAARIVYHLADGTTVTAVPQHERYLTFIPYSLWEQAHWVVALDAAGHEIAMRKVPGTANLPG